MDVIMIGIPLKYLVFLKSTLLLIFRSNSEISPNVSERPPNLSVAAQQVVQNSFRSKWGTLFRSVND